MADHILEGTTIKVRAKVSKGVANPADFQFKFFKDGAEVQQQASQSPEAGEENASVASEPGWVEAKFTVPNVDDTAEKYILTYKVSHGSETKEDFPAFTVWPKSGSLKVVNAKNGSKGLPGFRFKLMQAGRQQGEIRRVTKDDGTYNFDLHPGHAFSIDPVPPYKIPDGGWTTQTGRNRECKGDFDFEAAFLEPAPGAIKQYVNFIKDPTTLDVGRDGFGPVVRIKVGVKGDSDKSPDQRLGRAGMKIHVRATFGPKKGSGRTEKSTRSDDTYKTEIKDELDLSETSGPDADNIYKSKITLKDDGTGEMKVHLGLAGGDTCKIEIAGSDRFLNENTVSADATITFTNWRKLCYELLAPDFYEARELVDRVDPVTSTTHKDFPPAALAKLKELGDSCFIEYQFEAFHTFQKDDAPVGAAELTKKFLEIDSTNKPAYILTDYTIDTDPNGFAGWADTQPDITNYIKLCDANYYWEDTSARKHYLGDATTRRHTIPVLDGYFIPVSGNGDGTGAFSVTESDGGAEGFKWTAKVDLNSCKTVVDPIESNRPRVAGNSKSDYRIVKVKEINQNEQTEIEFVKPGRLSHVDTTVTDEQKQELEQWLTDRFAPDTLRAHRNKISIRITGETGNTRRDDRFNAVKTIVETKLNALKGTHSISVHPGLDGSGNPRTGTLTRHDVNMTESNRTRIVLDLPHLTPTDPGSFVGPMGTTKCPITIECYIEAHDEGLGLCRGKKVLACFAKANAAVDVCTTMHELGHSYGMAVFTTEDKPPKGMATPKKITETETEARYKTNGTKGHAYDQKNHSGSHCAHGLSDTQKASADYMLLPGSAAKCIMYGQGGANRTFCPQCIDLIRGSNLTVLPVVPGT